MAVFYIELISYCTYVVRKVLKHDHTCGKYDLYHTGWKQTLTPQGLTGTRPMIDHGTILVKLSSICSLTYYYSVTQANKFYGFLHISIAAKNPPSRPQIVGSYGFVVVTKQTSSTFRKLMLNPLLACGCSSGGLHQVGLYRNTDWTQVTGYLLMPWPSTQTLISLQFCYMSPLLY